MDELCVKKRTNLKRTIDVPIEFQLVLLLRSRKEMKCVCTTSSLALRIVILAFLASDGILELKDGKVIVRKAPDNPIHKVFVDRISQVKTTPMNIFKYINGEYSDFYVVKDLRRHVYKEMENRGLITIESGNIFRRIKILNIEKTQSIFHKIIEEVASEELSQETIILLVAINYANRLESILLHCNESTASKVIEQMEKIKKRIKNKEYKENNELMYMFLNAIIPKIEM